MANVSQLVNFGLGTPSDIGHYVLLGLTPNPSSYVASHLYLAVVPGESRRAIVPQESRRAVVPEDPRSVTEVL